MQTFEAYKRYIETDPTAVRLLKRIPWALIGATQENMPKILVNESGRLETLGEVPRFSLITPMYNTPVRLLEELIFSCLAQSWRAWELILIDDKSPDASHLALAERAAASDPRIRFIRSSDNRGIGGARNVGMAQARGDWVGFLDHDDLLHPQALGVFARRILDASKLGKQAANFMFSNECKITADSTQLRDFFIKPDLCLGTLLRSNYIAHLTFIERSFMESSRLPDGGYFGKGFDGVEDHEYFLRLAHTPGFVSQHVTEFCYYWRVIENSTSHSLSAKPYVLERGLKLIKDHLESIPHSEFRVDDLSAHLTRDQGQNRFFRASFATTRNLDRRILVIIPFRDGLEVTLACLESLEKQDVVLEIKLIDNESSEDCATALLAWTTKARKHRYLIESDSGTFNYAALNNKAFRRHSAGFEFVLFLNNDVELVDASTLRQMAAAFDYDNKLGFCGIKLWYPGKMQVQHGGIRIGLEAFGSGYFRPKHMDSMADFVFDDHVVTAVTFACAMTRVSLFEKLGGLDESWMPNGLGDVDICLRAMKLGFRNFYLGSASGIHHESLTRRCNDESLELSRLYEVHGDLISRQLRRQLGYDTFVGMNTAGGWLEKPLRYKVADRLNGFLKDCMRPIHQILKKMIH